MGKQLSVTCCMACRRLLFGILRVVTRVMKPASRDASTYPVSPPQAPRETGTHTHTHLCFVCTPSSHFPLPTSSFLLPIFPCASSLYAIKLPCMRLYSLSLSTDEAINVKTSSLPPSGFVSPLLGRISVRTHVRPFGCVDVHICQRWLRRTAEFSENCMCAPLLLHAHAHN